ncbi:MAG TPA: TlpA disulfide reductase family protein [Bdellovibrionota bacterium]|nr:TlpA disulfide reductase family protein [Bdellovibrionota bacterium]
MTTPGSTWRNLTKVLAPAVAILVIVVGGLYLVKVSVGRAPQAPGAFELNIGNTVPEFTLSRLGGGELKLSDLKSKVLLVNFWATWCEACLVEMPSIVSLRSRYLNRGFDVISINVDENPESVLGSSLKRLGIDFPVYLDRDGKTSELFGVHGIPLTVVMDQQRRILFVETGERDWSGEEIREQIERWLAE